ncbi:menaquinone biosynthesis protein [Alkalihalobacillus sp. MEB130]|uniref:menaquinone biosynthetic enzyme MqnA/MqnD family protein n=1 Tax=Alkalihalobacillus sp. MEB130 TaxID=2976704 RepID=UPI0028DEC71D|nr:menaquinone biosynthesis protein [Alkalihalobacillus sp. MEB130]MDT8860016.1 menaquinone biosynthesis protein [Alkalihalobacillus sp. MEB130]
MSVVIGEISYTNIMPFFYHLDRKMLGEHHCQFVPQVPAQLNNEMALGRIDIGGISSFAYAQHAQAFTLLPNLSVTSYGAVNSIFLFSKVPISELNEKKVALTWSSASSVHLLKIILEHFHSLSISYTTMNPNVKSMLREHEACLLIGDDAIVAKREYGQSLYHYDLGELWYEQTGLPMTFAVFAVRNETLRDHPSLVGLIYRSFLESKRESELKHYQPMIDAILKTHGGKRSFWEHYFQKLCNDFGEEEQKGLSYYFDLLYKMNYLSQPINKLHIWDGAMSK